MANRLSRSELNRDTFSGIASSEKFAEYTPEIQNRILDSLENRSQKEGGFMGKLFGNDKDLASMNVAVFICTVLMLICIIDIVQSCFGNRQMHMELISSIIPVISLAIGFIFGKGKGKNE